jgi:hypothetical protein
MLSAPGVALHPPAEEAAEKAEGGDGGLAGHVVRRQRSEVRVEAEVGGPGLRPQHQQARHRRIQSNLVPIL